MAAAEGITTSSGSFHDVSWSGHIIAGSDAAHSTKSKAEADGTAGLLGPKAVGDASAPAAVAGAAEDGAAAASPSISSSSSSSSSPSSSISTDPSTAHFRAWAARDPYLLLHKAIYLVGMGAAGSYFPFVVMRLGALGINGFEAGAVLASAHIAALCSAPALTAIADSRGEASRRAVLLGGAALSSALLYSMRFASSFWPVLVLQAFAEAASSATWPIVDASLMALLAASQPEGSTAGYGASRAFGAAGWGIYAAVAGALYDRYGMENAMFATYGLMILPFFPLLALIPLEKRGATKASVEGAWRKLLTVDVAVFLTAVAIMSALLFVVDSYRLPYLATELRAGNTLLGLSVTATSVSEVPAFFVAAAILRKVSLPTVLLGVMLVYVLRFVWYATLTDPWWTMPMELLHGAQFAFAWGASTAYVATLLPPELSSSAQGLLAAVQWGLGSAFGSLAGGYVYDRLGGRALMWWCAALGCVGAGVMVWSMLRTRRLRRMVDQGGIEGEAAGGAAAAGSAKVKGAGGGDACDEWGPA